MSSQLTDPTNARAPRSKQIDSSRSKSQLTVFFKITKLSTNLFENWNNAARGDSASHSVMFRLPWQSFARVPLLSARLVSSNSDHFFDHWGIFNSILLVEPWIIRLENLSIAENTLEWVLILFMFYFIVEHVVVYMYVCIYECVCMLDDTRPNGSQIFKERKCNVLRVNFFLKL